MKGEEFGESVAGAGAGAKGELGVVGGAIERLLTTALAASWHRLGLDCSASLSEGLSGSEESCGILNIVSIMLLRHWSRDTGGNIANRLTRDVIRG